MNNHGCYIGSLANLCRWLAQQAEGLGVEIYPGMAASEPVYGEDGALKGVVAGVFGIGKDGEHKPDYQPGMELHGQIHPDRPRARAAPLAKEVIRRFKLERRQRSAEVRHRRQGDLAGSRREVRAGPGPAHHGLAARRQDRRRLASCTTSATDYVALGFVVHLNYTNP